MNEQIIIQCKKLLEAYRAGELGQTKMPEDSNPGFKDNEREAKLAYFTLPMALNYQRDSYKLWESALKTYNDSQTRRVFDVKAVNNMSEDELRADLMKYRLALQPNKHTKTWKTIAKTVKDNFGSFETLIDSNGQDYTVLKKVVQGSLKKGFPYLSGPKIFNYWSFIIKDYGMVRLRNADQIEIAPDTHITQCSVRLGVISEKEALSLSRDDISQRWRNLLKGSGIHPIDMHPPLWFWSRNGYLFKLGEEYG